MGFAAISSFVQQILPFLIAIVLIVLIVMIIRISLLVKRLNATVSKADAILDTANSTIAEAQNTIKTANGYMDELKTTVHTVVNVSTSVEAVRATAEDLVKKGVNSFSRGYESTKKVINKYLPKKPATETKTGQEG